MALITAEAVIYLLAAHAGLTVNAQSAGILRCWCSARAPITRCCWSRGTGRNCAATTAATRRWRRRCAGPGPAIIASAATVILALLTLSAAELNSTKGLGPVLAIGVAVGMVAMITLLPALLVTFPRGVFWPYRPTYGSPEPTAPGDVGAGRLRASPPGPGWYGSAPPWSWASWRSA